MSSSVQLAVVVEDQLSLAVVKKVLAFVDTKFVISLTTVGRGVSKIRSSMPKYRNASTVMPHVILVDLDNSSCAPQLLLDWGMASRLPNLFFRVAVRETEAWVLADRQGFANFAGVPLNKLPQAPETVADPKQTLINIVRRSRSRRLASELVPPPRSRVSIGPLYNERLTAFIEDSWDVAAAAAAAPSLAKAIRRLRDFPNQS